MERASRAELINTVNSQRDQLQHYKAKLRDVVSAYKSVVKEKEALEASFSALSVSNRASVKETKADGAESDQLGDVADREPPDPLGVHKKEGNDEITSSMDQVQTLSAALTTLSQEKNKIEANFIADKKKLRQENDELQAQVLDEKKRSSSQMEGFELQITYMKSRIRTQQLEREREQTDHALMLKELQSLVEKERNAREALETQLEEVQLAAQVTQQEPVVSELYEKQIRELQGELRMVRDRLKSAEVKANEPSPFVVELQKEMTSMKTNYQKQVEKEQQKAAEAESRLKIQSAQSEERVSNLEAKLSELSQVVGNYERLRFQDQQAISKLRERVSQLDTENTALTHAACLNPEKPEDEEHNLTAEQILGKIMHLRSRLKSAIENTDGKISLAQIFVEDLNKADEESPLCRQYKEELESVKEEFERYKLRAQSVLKNKNKDMGTTREMELMKEHVADLREKLRMSNFHNQEETSQFQAKIDNLSKTVLAQEEKSKLEIAQLKAMHQNEISELATQSKKQRERTVALLAEKDQELQRLRAHSGQSLDTDCLRHWTHESDVEGLRRDGLAEDYSQGELSEEKEAVIKLLGLPKGMHREAAFLHFMQEKGRMEVELAGLRKQKRQMELTLRDLQASALQKEEMLRDELNASQEQLAQIARQDSREGANLEYLKNVLLKFLISIDPAGKKQMMKALMTILQFSPEERDKVEQAQIRGWWPT